MANRTSAFIFFAMTCALASGCGAREAAMPALQNNSALALSGTGVGKIKHVVWIVQENRSFNDMFQGFPNATTAPSGTNSYGQTVKLKPISLKVVYDIDHGAQGMFAACAGKGKLPGTDCTNEGFNLEQQAGGPADGQYGYVPHSESKPYWDMAHEFVLADHMFASQLDESFVAHQYIVAAQAQSSVDVPYGPWGCEGGSRDLVSTITKQRTFGKSQVACFDYTTLGDELDAKKLSWRFYTSPYSEPLGGYWSGYQAVKHIIDGPDWKYVITPQKKFLTDIKKGQLSSMTWITPLCEDSDHLACGNGYGPSWVTSLVNAVGESKFWDSTVVFVQWDDWGGMYDPVPPPFKDYDSLGFRVGLMVISAYAKKNYVSHTQYETASVMRYAEDLFGLPQMTKADARATSPAADCLDFSQKPRAFVPIKAPKGPDFFLQQPLDPRIPDSDF